MVKLKLKKLETAATTTTSTPPATGIATTFDIYKHIKFVTQFQEKEVDKYFLHFEKAVTSLMGSMDA